MEWDGPTLRRLRRSVLPVHGPAGPIGTGTVIATGVALTALHVIAPEPVDQLGFGHRRATGHGLPVRATATLPPRRFGGDRALARRSQRRARELAGDAGATVDLALLAVPELRAPTVPLRATSIQLGEQIMVPGYPGGEWSITQGPVIGLDDADFTVHLLLGPGASGAPAIDQAGRLAGVVTLDNEAGTICIGPALLTAFTSRLRTVFSHVRGLG
jgi:Trypsin-like peptidase domain